MMEPPGTCNGTKRSDGQSMIRGFPAALALSRGNAHHVDALVHDRDAAARVASSASARLEGAALAGVEEDDAPPRAARRV